MTLVSVGRELSGTMGSVSGAPETDLDSRHVTAAAQFRGHEAPSVSPMRSTSRSRRERRSFLSLRIVIGAYLRASSSSISRRSTW